MVLELDLLFFDLLFSEVTVIGSEVWFTQNLSFVCEKGGWKVRVGVVGGWLSNDFVLTWFKRRVNEKKGWKIMGDLKETNLHNSCKHGHFTIMRIMWWCRPPVIRLQHSFFWPSQVQHQHQQQQQTHQHHHHHLHRHYLNITKKVVFRFKALLKCDVLLFSGAVMSDCSVIRPSTFQIFWPFYWKKNSFDDVIPGDHWREDELKMKAPPLEKLPTSLSLESLAWVWGNYTNWIFDWIV